MEYAIARKELLERPGRTGPASRKALVGLTDDWLRSIFAQSGAAEAGCALVAVGGLGRGHLAPGSDLDLLLLHPAGAQVGEIAERIWYPVWDGGVRLDHSVRTPAEARRLAGKDIKVVLGLLDARTVVGDDELTATLRSAVLEDWRALAPRRLEELHGEVLGRAQRNGDLAHLLEPDLKESYGGLRDVTVLRAIAASWIVDTEARSLDAPVTALLDARDALHQVTGRANDRLTLQEQGPVANLLGDQDSDVLLRRVSAAGRSIAYACDVAWHRVDRVTSKRRINPIRRLRGGRPERAPLADGVVVQDGEAVLAVDARPDRDPVLMLRTAAAAAQAGLRLSNHAVERLATESAPMPSPWPVAARDSLVSLIGAGRSALPVWEALDQADLITRLIPEWEVVRSAPQRNPVHRFTVDRHLVETAANASSLTRRVSRPDLLLVGALLHDIGKGQPGDHTDVGVGIVEQLAPRLGFNEQDSAILVSLVANHLLLPDTATRRDLSDPTTAQTVADAVGSIGVLDLLDALTRADAAATGPAAWSQWKAGLVDELVARTRAVLAGSPVPEPPVLTEAQHELGRSEGVRVASEQSSGAWEVTVAADDRVGLLGTVAGVMALHRLAVRSARTETVGQRAVTVWTVQPEFGDPPTVEQLRADVRLALDGRLDVAGKLRERAAAYARTKTDNPAPPVIELFPEASSRSVVMEVRAHDAPGLLHTIGSAIASTGVDIAAAQVATLGSDVVDVFYLGVGGGQPSDAHIQRVSQAVLSALESAG